MTINIFCALPPALLGAIGAVLGFLGRGLGTAAELLGLLFLGLITVALFEAAAETEFPAVLKTESTTIVTPRSSFFPKTFSPAALRLPAVMIPLTARPPMRHLDLHRIGM